ncbi:MAG: HAD family phosphatase [Mycobacteriaceae bacterium]|nr:HAD family phosphatase [Mycobacteriaceae bacterium]
MSAAGSRRAGQAQRSGEPRLRAVLWDMDGTILDSERLWDVAVYELAARLGGTLTPQTRQAMIGATAPAALATMFAAFNLDPTPQAFDDARDWLDNRVVAMFAEEVPWRPGAKDALGLVRDAGLRTALVTNTKRRLTECALDIIGRDFFDVSVCGDEVLRGKPDPQPYLRAAALLGVDPAECVAIEDSPTGAASAEAAGCAVIVVPCEVAVPPGPARVFRSGLEGLRLADVRDALAVRGPVRPQVGPVCENERS